VQVGKRGNLLISRGVVPGCHFRSSIRQRGNRGWVYDSQPSPLGQWRVSKRPRVKYGATAQGCGPNTQSIALLPRGPVPTGRFPKDRQPIAEIECQAGPRSALRCGRSGSGPTGTGPRRTDCGVVARDGYTGSFPRRGYLLGVVGAGADRSQFRNSWVVDCHVPGIWVRQPAIVVQSKVTPARRPDIASTTAQFAQRD